MKHALIMNFAVVNLLGHGYNKNTQGKEIKYSQMARLFIQKSYLREFKKVQLQVIMIETRPMRDWFKELGSVSL